MKDSKFDNSRWGSSSSSSTSWGKSWESDSYDDDYTPWWKRKSKKSYTSRLGFGKTEEKSSYSYYSPYGYGGYGSSYYSSYYSSPKDKTLEVEKLETLKKAFSNSRDLVNILEFPYRLNIYFDNKAWVRNCNQHVADWRNYERNIYLWTSSVLDNISEKRQLTDEKKEECIQIVSGNSIHEASHLKFTTLVPIYKYFGSSHFCIDDTVIPLPTDEINKFLRKFGLTDKDGTGYRVASALLYQTFCYLEDERVDTFMLEERNGWYDYLTTYKNYCYEKLLGKGSLGYFSKDKVYITEFFMILTKLIRFPDRLEEHEVTKYGHLLEKTKEYLNSKNTLESCINAFQIFKHVISIVLLNNARELEKLEEELNNYEKAMKSEDKVIMNLSSSVTADRDLLSFLGKSIKVSNVTSGSDKSTSILDDNASLARFLIGEPGFEKSALDIITGEIEGDYKKGIYFYKPVGSLSKYDAIRTKVSPYIPAMKNMVRNVNKNYEFIIHGQRNGKLDTNKLAEAYQGVPQVYTKQGATITTGMNVCVVVDESGSMSFNDRYNKAKEAAVLINESFGSIKGVNLFIYGHSADQVGRRSDDSTELYIYREPGLKYNGVPGIGCTEIAARSENRDGTAIKAIAERVRTKTSQPVLMFILSDGDPSACDYRGEEAIRDTKKKVDEVEAMGFYVIQVTIDNTSCEPSRMFKNYIDLTDSVSKLPSALGAIVRDQIVKILQNNTTTTI